MKDITLDQAHDAVKAARKKAEEMDLKMDIAVVDAGANLKFFIRMDNSWLGSIDIAIKKAKTAGFFDMPTSEIGKLSKPGESPNQIGVSATFLSKTTTRFLKPDSRNLNKFL